MCPSISLSVSLTKNRSTRLTRCLIFQMKVLLGLAALLIVVFAESENTDLAQNIETAFEHYLRVEKKDG